MTERLPDINDRFQQPGRGIKSYWVFVLVWLIVFVLYIPAAKGGWVHDTVDWLKRIKEEKFVDYINIMQSLVPSLYQFTQFTTYIFYRLFHAHPWPWHLLFITLHAANATLLFTIISKLFKSAGFKHGTAVALGGVLLFSICPHISEVIVWKASFHYLQGLLLMLAIVYWAQQYIYRRHARYAWLGAGTFICSAFSLEYFYLTPWIVLSLAAYYFYVLKVSGSVFRKMCLYFVLPMLLVFCGHLILLHHITGYYAGHLGDDIKQPLAEYLRKPPVHLFHNLFMGRFFPDGKRQWVQDFFAARKGLVLFYALFLCMAGYIMACFKKMDQPAKAAVLILTWLIMCMALVCPVWIPDIQLVLLDRYSYFMLPFIYILLCFALVRVLPFKVAAVLFAVYALFNVYFTVKVNRYWKQSSHIVYNLAHFISDPGDKTVLLLNLPTNMHGIQMIGSLPASAFRQIYNVNNERQLNNPVYDVLAYNMNTDTDGAHVAIYNDTLLHVTLNQWGTWWWYGRTGARSYENESYKVNLMDPGHWYELTLKRPASNYLLLYQVGDHWKTVDVNKKNIDQY